MKKHLIKKLVSSISQENLTKEMDYLVESDIQYVFEILSISDDNKVATISLKKNLIDFNVGCMNTNWVFKSILKDTLSKEKKEKMVVLKDYLLKKYKYDIKKILKRFNKNTSFNIQACINNEAKRCFGNEIKKITIKKLKHINKIIIELEA